MKSLLIALLTIAGMSLAATNAVPAAPANGIPIANALTQFDRGLIEPVACRRICDWRGCRTRCFGGPVYVAPPLYVAPVPVCRSVRICDWRGCIWRRRC